MTASNPILITTANNLEGLLLDEATALGLINASQTRGAVRGDADRETVYRILLGSRLASRVLLPLTQAPADDADAFYTALRAFPWEDHLLFPLRLAVQCHGRSQGIRHTRFGAQRVKDAIADRARAAGASLTVDREDPDARISVRLRDDGAELALDLSGESLHRRGYRRDQGEAPLKEPLAAAILMRAGWPARAAHSRVLFDPCCGAGTLLAEGAMMAADLAPGLLRDRFGLAGWRQHSEADWRACREAASERVIRNPDALPRLIGRDSDPGAIRAAEANLARLDTACPRELTTADAYADEPAWPTGPGVLVTNPPYGHRIQGGHDAASLYERLGERARQELAGWRVAVFSDRSEHLAALGLQSRRVYKLLNGQLTCRLGVYDIHAQPAPAATQSHPPAPPELRNRLHKNLKHLARWRRRGGITAYRLYAAEIPEYPVTIDVYEAEGGTQARISADEAASHVPRRKAEARRRGAVTAVAEVLALPRTSIHTESRRDRDAGASARTETAPIIAEGPARYQLDPAASGLFLAQRGLRERLRQDVAGERFLNLAPGTGAATVQAALADALSTTSVEPDADHATWLRAQFDLNGLAGADEHEIVSADVPGWLASTAGGPQRWDIALLDVNTTAANPDTGRRHELIRSAMAVLASGGRLYVVSSDPGFAPDPEALAPYGLEELTRKLIPPDFERSGSGFRCWRLRVSDGSAA